MTDELRIVKSFLEFLKVETLRRQENGQWAISFTNMKPGYRTSITLELDHLLPLEMSVVMRRLLEKAQFKASRQSSRCAQDQTRPQS